jgi:hypothetical protein
MAKNAQLAADKWAAGMAAAGPAITAGVQGVTTAPGVAAAANAAGYAAGVQAAVASGKWQQAVAAVPLQNWQQSMLQKGLPRVGTGAAAAKPKFTQFLQALISYQSNLVTQLPPRGTADANRARMNAWFDGMKQFRKPAGT